jgi:Arc/MetJ family transcription regulator
VRVTRLAEETSTGPVSAGGDRPGTFIANSFVSRSLLAELLYAGSCLNNTQEYVIVTHRKGSQTVRTNIEIDDALMRQAMRRSGATTKKAAVEEALRLLVKTHEQASISRWRGKVRWDGNLKQLRRSRVPQ